MSDTIIIHEFSTGIEVERTPDGGWISRGFSGRWMNQTNSQIPYAVESAISNKEFEARCLNNSHPAIIGRVVRGNENDYWSIVAVITIGADESRGFSAYRYFFCQGKENLCVIVGWLNEQKEIPTFNPLQQPFQPVYINSQDAQKHRKYAFDIDQSIKNELNQDNELRDSYRRQPPIILKERQYDNQIIIDRLAHKNAQDNNRLISWAYNVEALEKPEKFLIIQPVTQEAYNKFQSVERSPIVYSEIANERELKLAIEDLSKAKNIKENLRFIEKALEEFKKYDVEQAESFLNRVFEIWGASKVIQEKSYGFNMLEIVSLRAILLPNTLIEYLFYSKIENAKKTNIFGNKDNSNKENALNFLKKLRKEIQSISFDLTNIKQKLRDGLLNVIEEFYKNDTSISLDTLIWLISDTDSVWCLGKQELLATIKSDLERIHELRQTKKLEQLPKNIKSYTIYNHLINHYWRNRKPISSYKPLSDLFLAINDYELAHYFYVIGTGKFNDKIIQQLPKNKQDIFGIQINLRNSNLTVYSDNRTNNSDNNGNDINTIVINIILSLIIFILLLISLAIRPFNWNGVIIVIISIIFMVIYVTEGKIRSIINKYSLPIIMLALLLGNFSNLDISSKNILIREPNTPQNSSKQTENPQPNGNDVPVGGNTDPNILNNAVKAFTAPKKTKEAIQEIVKNLTKQYPSLKNEDVIRALKIVIEIENKDNQDSFSYTNMVKNNDKKQLEKFVTHIYNYQQKNNIRSNNGSPDAIIEIVPTDKQQRTMNILQQDIENELRNQQKISY